MIQNGVLVLCSIMMLAACSDKVGFATPPRFDSSTHRHSYHTVDTVLLAANSVPWFFSELRINGRYVHFKDSSIRYKLKQAAPGAVQKLGDIVQFENDWFSVEKLSNERIRVRMKENATSGIRRLNFSVSVGAASTKISCVQEHP